MSQWRGLEPQLPLHLNSAFNLMCRKMMRRRRLPLYSSTQGRGAGSHNK